VISHEGGKDRIVTPVVICDTEELEDIKGEIRILISKKDRQHHGQKKTNKRTNNNLHNIHIKLKFV
jgi:hypothetical protein